MEDIKKRLQRLMLFRIIIASFFLGIAAVIQLQRSQSYIAPYLVYIYGLAGIVYLLTLVYLAIMGFIRAYKTLAYVQIMIDVILITALIFITGGVNSIFSFMYSISIISASIFLYLLGGLLTATLSSLLYAALITFQHYDILAPFQVNSFVATGYTDAPFYYQVIVNVASFYLVALLSSFLAEQARKSSVQLQRKQIDIENLEALNENIIQSINSGLVTLDLDSRVMTFNRAAEEITGLLRREVFLKGVEEVFPDLDLAEHQQRPADGFVSPRFELDFTRPDDKVLHLVFLLSVLRDNSGSEMGNILIFQDLTSFKDMQEYVKRMDRLAAVGRLAAGIAHEVRNPLASISGSIQVLHKSLQLSDADKRLMDIIVKESNSLSSLISDFTQFARPDKQKKERVNLHEITREVIDIFKNSPDCRDVHSINEDIAPELFITANYQQFRQVLWNLLINATQAMNNGEGRISISARLPDDDFDTSRHSPSQKTEMVHGSRSPCIEIQVQDTGCGIKQEIIDKIFDPFYTTKDNGTGLGLSVVHKIIQEHDGTISVKSSEERGTVFSIYLPRSM